MKVSIFIMGNLRRLLMDRSIQFDHQPFPMAIEIHDEASDRHLTAELQAQQAAITEQAPERFFGRRLLSA
jgi:hypothetical protein